jgi:neutral ceramidase
VNVLKAGFGKISITPSVGSPLAGFAAREGVCEGIHDELHSRALVLENEAIAVIIISLDVLAVSGALVKRVRDRIQSRLGIDAGSILIASTHTHAGPVTIKTFFNPD